MQYCYNESSILGFWSVRDVSWGFGRRRRRRRRQFLPDARVDRVVCRTRERLSRSSDRHGGGA